MIEIGLNKVNKNFGFNQLLNDVSFEIKTNEIYAMYDIQTKMCDADQMIDFQNTYIKVIETVLAQPEAPLNELF